MSPEIVSLIRPLASVVVSLASASLSNICTRAFGKVSAVAITLIVDWFSSDHALGERIWIFLTSALKSEETITVVDHEIVSCVKSATLTVKLPGFVINKPLVYFLTHWSASPISRIPPLEMVASVSLSLEAESFAIPSTDIKTIPV